MVAPRCALCQDSVGKSLEGRWCLSLSAEQVVGILRHRFDYHSSTAVLKQAAAHAGLDASGPFDGAAVEQLIGALNALGHRPGRVVEQLRAAAGPAAAPKAPKAPKSAPPPPPAEPPAPEPAAPEPPAAEPEAPPAPADEAPAEAAAAPDEAAADEAAAEEGAGDEGDDAAAEEGGKRRRRRKRKDDAAEG